MYNYVNAILPVRVCSIVFQLLGITGTAWRIYFRIKIYRFWWEDAWAVVVMLSCLATLVGEWVSWLADGLPSIVGYWLYSLGFTSIIRSTHLSILFSIIRIIRETPLRRFTYLWAVLCGIFWAVLISGKTWRCASNPSWHHTKFPGCGVMPQMLIFEFSSDCVTVGVLIVIPLRVLWRVKLPPSQRRMILSIFASSVVLAFAAVFHVVGRALNLPILATAGVDFQIVSSVVVCNLLVVVTYTYRVFCYNDSDGTSKPTTMSETDTDDFTQPIRRPLTLTTIELNSSTLMTSQDDRITAQGRSVCIDSVNV